MRRNADKPSKARLELRVTSDEAEQIKALAAKKQTTVSELFRSLVVAEQDRMQRFAQARDRWEGPS